MKKRKKYGVHIFFCAACILLGLAMFYLSRRCDNDPFVLGLMSFVACVLVLCVITELFYVYYDKNRTKLKAEEGNDCYQALQDIIFDCIATIVFAFVDIKYMFYPACCYLAGLGGGTRIIFIVNCSLALMWLIVQCFITKNCVKNAIIVAECRSGL